MGSGETSHSTSGNGDGSENKSDEASLNPPRLRDAAGKVDLDSYQRLDASDVFFLNSR